jgi:hypothetical protein
MDALSPTYQITGFGRGRMKLIFFVSLQSHERYFHLVWYPFPSEESGKYEKICTHIADQFLEIAFFFTFWSMAAAYDFCTF